MYSALPRHDLPVVLPVLVIACNRPAIKRCLDQLIEWVLHWLESYMWSVFYPALPSLILCHSLYVLHSPSLTLLPPFALFFCMSLCLFVSLAFSLSIFIRLALSTFYIPVRWQCCILLGSCLNVSLWPIALNLRLLMSYIVSSQLLLQLVWQT